eukprot:9126675-Pyramimonas_sp.AAC.1
MKIIVRSLDQFLDGPGRVVPEAHHVLEAVTGDVLDVLVRGAHSGGNVWDGPKGPQRLSSNGLA